LDRAGGAEKSWERAEQSEHLRSITVTSRVALTLAKVLLLLGDDERLHENPSVI
jgi:hypothetical protein